MGTRVGTDRYREQHGKAPSGLGFWQFEVAGKRFYAGLEEFDEAERMALAKAREAGTSLVYVLP